MDDADVLLQNVEELIQQEQEQILPTDPNDPSNLLLSSFLKPQPEVTIMPGLYQDKFVYDNPKVNKFFEDLKLREYIESLRNRWDVVNVNNLQNNTYNSMKKLKEDNEKCLQAAAELLTKAKESYEKFKGVSTDYKKIAEKSQPESSMRSSFKNMFGIGRAAKYNEMTTDKNIPEGLYFLMLVFAFALCCYESEFRVNFGNFYTETYLPNSTRESDKTCLNTLFLILRPPYVNRERQVTDNSRFTMLNIFENLSFGSVDLGRIKEYINTKILDALPEFNRCFGSVPEQPSQGGASRRRTRQHRRNSSHSRKSVRQNKKGRKLNKIHRTKYRVHRRKLNKSKTKQRK